MLDSTAIRNGAKVAPADEEWRSRASNVSLVGFLALLAIYTIVSVGGFPFIDTLSLDAAAVERIAARGGGQAFEGSYATAAFFYAALGEARGFFVFGCAALMFYISTRSQTSWLSMGTVGLLIFPAIVFFLTQLNKDTLLVPFIAMVWLALTSNWKPITKLIVVALTYVSYAFLFRTYYYLIDLLFVMLVVFAWLPGQIRFVVYASLPFFVIMFVSMAPPELFDTLTSSRDAINSSRSSIQGSRTMFMNSVYPDGFVPFLINYLNAFTRLNFPVLYSFSLTELFLQIYVLIVLYLSTSFALSKYRAVRYCGLLVLCHVAVLICFEPDLGSYLRHLSSVAPYLAAGLAMSTAQRGAFVEPRAELAAA